MIPWVREKFAERRARWIASRKRNESPSSSSVPAANDISTTTTIGGGTTSTGLATGILHRNGHQIINNNNNNNNSVPNCSHRVMIEQHQHQQQQLQQKQKLQNNHLSTGTTTKTTTKLKSDSHVIQKDSGTNDKQSKSKQISVKIRSPKGKEIVLQISTTSKIIDLKFEALQKFSQDSNELPLFATDVKHLLPKYRFLRPDSQISFQEEYTLDQAGISNNETLNLCIKRTKPLIDIDNLRGPTITDITLATVNVPQSEPKPKKAEIAEFLLQSDLQFDVRKVIISLAQSSAYVIGSGPYAERLITMFKQKLINKRKHQNDTLQCLVDMGFSEEKASYALKISNGNYSTALDWLIEHQSDEIQHDVSSSSLTTSVSKLSENNDMIGNVQTLLEIIRIYSQRDMSPPPEIVSALTDMGFPEKDVLKALRVTRNNQAAACEWLCGNRSTSLTELRDGLSSESPIYKAMMESPQIQMSLSNPKMFIAYMSMLEDHNALSMWLGDSDTSLVLSHILRKYHEEKHILGVNQFNCINTNNISNTNNPSNSNNTTSR